MDVTQGDEHYWLWVVDPDHYLDENGEETKALEPGQGGKGADWWTCHQDTQKGDLAFLWRTVKSDIRYLMRAESKARSLTDYPYARKQGWKWGCDWRVLYKFEHPLTIKELRGDARFQDWSALNANFRQRSWAIPAKHWSRINYLVCRKNPGYSEFTRGVQIGKSAYPPVSTQDLEEAIAALGEGSYYQRSLKVVRLIRRRHNKLSNDFTRWLKKVGCTGIRQERGRIDVEFQDKGKPYCVELKICYGICSTRAIRDALSQLLEYNFYPSRRRFSGWTIMLDEQPTEDDIEYVRTLKREFGFPLSMGWREGSEFAYANGLQM